MALQILPGPDLSGRSTLKMGGRALAEILYSSTEDLEDLAKVLKGIGGTPLVLGAGSNALFRDGELPLVIVASAPRCSDAEVVGEVGDRTVVRACSSLRLPRLLARLTSHGLTGMEGLCGIPGTIGGAVAMNAGSYGTDIDAHLWRVRVWSPDSGDLWLARGQWRAGYRKFLPLIEGDWWICTEAEFILSSSTREEVRRNMVDFYERKKATQPILAASAGCVFKNPPADWAEGRSAGRLLELAGFRGKMHGGVGFSSVHANFLVNLGGGTAVQALELIGLAREAVAAEFGVRLELEVKVYP